MGRNERPHPSAGPAGVLAATCRHEETRRNTGSPGGGGA